MKNIGFFDSGVGGLTVLSQAMDACPGCHFHYYCDTDHLPYGEKTKSEIQKYVLEAGYFLLEKGVQALVIACNTATSAAVEELRKALPIPVIGMEPAISLAHRTLPTKSMRILVMATHLTLNEGKYQRLLQHLDLQDRVDGVALPGLVKYAEELQFNPEVIQPYLEDSLSHLDLSTYGSVVLGCTHFPFFRSVIRPLFPVQSMLVDGTIGTVNHLVRQIDISTNVPKGHPVKMTFYRSGREIANPDGIEVFHRLIARAVAEYESVTTSTLFC